MKKNAFLLIVSVCTAPAAPALAGDGFDIVIANGRVMDPETGLDAIRNVGIRGQTENTCDQHQAHQACIRQAAV